MLGLTASIEAMRSAVVRSLPPALAAGGRLVAWYARANHPYTNRTYRLQRSTEYQFTAGSFEGGYKIRVDGGMHYGSYVDLGTSINHRTGRPNRPYPYLMDQTRMGSPRPSPPWVAEGDTVARIVEASMIGAIENL
jgi:hypothetical protein